MKDDEAVPLANDNGSDVTIPSQNNVTAQTGSDVITHTGNDVISQAGNEGVTLTGNFITNPEEVTTTTETDFTDQTEKINPQFIMHKVATATSSETAPTTTTTQPSTITTTTTTTETTKPVAYTNQNPEEIPVATTDKFAATKPETGAEQVSML